MRKSPIPGGAGREVARGNPYSSVMHGLAGASDLFRLVTRRGSLRGCALSGSGRTDRRSEFRARDRVAMRTRAVVVRSCAVFVRKMLPVRGTHPPGERG